MVNTSDPSKLWIALLGVLISLPVSELIGSLNTDCYIICIIRKGGKADWALSVRHRLEFTLAIQCAKEIKLILFDSFIIGKSWEHQKRNTVFLSKAFLSLSTLSVTLAS